MANLAEPEKTAEKYVKLNRQENGPRKNGIRRRAEQYINQY